MYRTLVTIPLVALSLLSVAACGSSAKTPTSAASVTDTAAPPASTATAAATAPGAGTSPTAASAGSAAPDTCGLLTTEEVATAVGAAVTSSAKAFDPPLGGNSCTWASSGVPVRTFNLTVRSTAGFAPALRSSGETAAKLFQQTVDLAKQTGSAGAVALPGVGEQAFVLTGNRAVVLKGELFLSSTVGFGTSDTAKKALVTLTTAAAAHL